MPEPLEKKLRLAGMSVLLIDDSDDNRELISIFLRHDGAEVATADNGQAGLEAIHQKDFDVVLMDIQMPVMDGRQAMTALKAMGYTRPVIALTARAMKDEREQSLGLGFSAYLTKPISRADLTFAVESFRD